MVACNIRYKLNIQNLKLSFQVLGAYRDEGCVEFYYSSVGKMWYFTIVIKIYMSNCNIEGIYRKAAL